MSLTKDKIRKFLAKSFHLGDEVENIADDTSLMGTGLLDSLSSLQLVQFLEENYNIKIELSELKPDNFGTLNKLEKFVEKKMGKKSA